LISVFWITDWFEVGLSSGLFKFISSIISPSFSGERAMSNVDRGFFGVHKGIEFSESKFVDLPSRDLRSSVNNELVFDSSRHKEIDS
jgi:hypothetical protein